MTRSVIIRPAQEADLPAIMAHDAAARSQAGLIAAKRAALV